ncbi:hypothetical protein Tco_1139846, partial [Tanacetum coccineum]
DTKIPQFSGPPVKVGDEVVHKELGDRIERAATTASSLETEKDSDAQTRFEAASKQSNDPPLSRVNTLGSGEDSMKLIELMAHCTTLSVLEKELRDNVSIKTEREIVRVKIGDGNAFWMKLSTLEDGVMEITTTIDGRVKTITEASIRRHLKLEDSDGISTLHTVEIFEQLALMGIHTNIFEQTPKTSSAHKRTYPTPTLTQKLFSNITIASNGYSKVNTPLFQTMLVED